MDKIALVLEGGGLRGIFTGGVTDCFIDNNIEFDYVCGVSAGSCNTLSYVAKSRGFVKRCMMQEDKKNAFYGVQQMVESHKIMDLEKVFNEYTYQYNYSYEAFLKGNNNWEFVATNIETGLPEYLHSNDVEKIKKMGTASCSIPIITSPVAIDGNLYLDGGISDSVPIQRALDKGYDKVVVVCTRKKGSYSRVKDSEKLIFSQLYKDYPKFLETVNKRTQLYKDQITMCEELEKEGKVILIRPTLPEVSRLESDLDELSLSYYHGYTKAEEYLDKIRNW